MPYEAAKHLAATFCYQIRYALVPLFGPEFVSMCYRPEHPSFGRMIISRDVVKRCIAAAQGARVSNGESSLASPTSPNRMASFMNAQTICKRKRSTRGRDLIQPPPSDSDYASDSETDVSERCWVFPDARMEQAWKFNQRKRRRSRRQSRRGSVKPAGPMDMDVQMPPTPTTMATEERTREKRSWSIIHGVEEEDEHDDENDQSHVRDGSSNTSSPIISSPCAKRRRSGWTTGEARAAYMLMQLHVADSSLGGAEAEAEADDDEDEDEDEDDSGESKDKRERGRRVSSWLE